MPNRRERRSRPISIAPVIALAILATGLAIAQQNLPVPPPKAPAPATGEAATAAADGTAATEAPGTGAASPNAKPVAAKGSPQRFEPTEKVRPDFDVAFPVDI